MIDRKKKLDYVQIENLWLDGKTTGEIALLIGSDHIHVRRILIRLGIYEPRMPQKQKGYVPENGRAKSHFKDEWKGAMQFDESRHWFNHPECLRYVSAQVAARRYHRNKNNALFILKLRCQSRLWGVLKRQCVIKTRRTHELVGCDMAKLKRHIESQFKRGMNWKNYGKHWEIDHIRPCASFDLSNVKELSRCFHFTNLQPLPKSINRAKHSTYKGVSYMHRRAVDNFYSGNVSK